MTNIQGFIINKEGAHDLRKMGENLKK